MAKRPAEEWPEATWTSMIDIIFQLLIFFMVVLSVGTFEQQAYAQAEGEEQENLPEMPAMKNLGEAMEITPGSIVIHVDTDKEDKVPGDWIVYLLNDKIPTVDEAKKDSTHSAGPFSWDVAFKKIQTLINNKRFNYEELPRVDMRAVSKFQYGNVLDVMNLCYSDDEKLRINQVYFRLARLAD